MPAAALLLALATSLAGCATPQGAQAQRPAAEVCSASSAALLSPVGEPRSSTIVLAVPASGPHKGKLLALVADLDGDAVVVVDVEGKQQLSSLSLGSSPGQLLLLPDGRVLVTMKRDDQLLVLHPKEDASLSLGCSLSVGAEPAAMAIAGDELLVSAAWSGTVEVLGLGKLERRATIEVAREPRQLWVDDDGKHAFVTHAVGGAVSVIDLAARKLERTIDLLTGDGEVPTTPSLGASIERAIKPKRVPGEEMVRVGSQGFALAHTRRPGGRLLAPLTLVDPGPKTARTQGYGQNPLPVIASVAVIDQAERRLSGLFSDLSGPMLAMLEDGQRGGLDVASGAQPCVLPRDAIVDDESTTLLVACLGIDAVIAYDAASSDPHAVEKIRWNVPAGPTGVALDEKGRRAVVFSQHDRALQVLRLDAIDALEASAEQLKEDRIALPLLKDGPGLPYILGRQIFYASGDPRISVWGMACASCHVDGRDDGLVWATPDGPRRTRTLDVALGDEEPLGWDGGSKGERAFLEKEFARLAGRGLRNVQLEALLTYVRSLSVGRRSPRAADAALAAKGQALFASPQVGCASCHVGGGADDQQHDVGTRTSVDRQGGFDTPDLRGVARRAPYFHDGRHATLEDVLRADHGAADAGPLGPLAPDDQAALLAYLRSL